MTENLKEQFILNQEELADMLIYDALPADIETPEDEPTVRLIDASGTERVVPLSEVLADRPSDLYPSIFGNYEDLVVTTPTPVPCNFDGAVTPSNVPKLVETAISDLVTAETPFRAKACSSTPSLLNTVLRVTAPRLKEPTLSEIGPLLLELKAAVASLDKRLAKLETRYGTLPL